MPVVALSLVPRDCVDWRRFLVLEFYGFFGKRRTGNGAVEGEELGREAGFSATPRDETARLRSK
jgi:hypothetical protein